MYESGDDGNDSSEEENPEDEPVEIEVGEGILD